MSCEKPTAPKRSTGREAVREGKEATRIEVETATETARRPVTRVTRASSTETDQKYTVNVKKSRPSNDVGKVLLRVLEELKDPKNASVK